MFSSNYCFHMFALPGVKKSNTIIKLAGAILLEAGATSEVTATGFEPTNT